MQTILYSVLAIIAIVLGLNIMNWCFKQPNNIIYLAAFIYVYEVVSHLFSFSVDIIRLGPLRLGPSDTLYILMLFMVLVKNAKYHTVKYLKKGTLAVYSTYCAVQALFLISVLRGLLTYGFTSDTSTDFRRFYDFLIPIMFMLNFKVDFNNRKVSRFIDKFMMFVVSFCYVMWLVIIVTGVRLQTTTNEGGTYLRIFGPDTTFVLAIYALFCLNKDLKIQDRISSKTMLVMLAVIIMQQRTVWVCFAIGAVLVLMNYRSDESQERKFIIGKRFFIQCTIMVAAVIGIIIASPQSGIFNDLTNSFSSFSNLSEGTFAYRTMIWQGHLSTLKGLNAIIGKPFGAGYEVTLAAAGYSRVLSAHNGFIMVALRTGYLGVALFVLLLAELIWKGYRQRKLSVLIFSLMIAVYFVGYSFDWHIGLGLGFCLRSIIEDEEPIAE